VATIARTVRSLIGVAAVLVLWEVTSRSGLVPPAYVPPPTRVAAAMTQLLTDPQFHAATVSTGLSWVIAVVCATAAGVVLGLLVGSVAALHTMVMPLVEVLRPLPTVALIPLAVVVLGTDAQTKITLAVFAATWPILLNTVYALDDRDTVQLDTARVYRVPRVHVLLRLTVPAIAPAVLTGVRFSASVALIVLVGTEFLAGGTPGLGQIAYIWGSSAGRMDVVLAVIVFAAVANCGVDAALTGAQQRWLSWSTGTVTP
jgi:NitT/TauT family transport system permease protein